MYLSLITFLFSRLVTGGTQNLPYPAHISPEDCKDVEYLITSNGYPVEKHTATTADGYIITMHRIPYGRSECSTPCHRTPLYATTGLLADSATYVLNMPEQSLGFVLADNGYDVWMGNVRGNYYGRRHTSLSPASPEFWNFTFNEHGMLDDPAQIDYILNHTGRSSLLYLGWSQGTLMFFIMLSERPEYNQKIRAFAGLAPVRHMRTIEVPWMAAGVPVGEPLLGALREIGIHELLPRDPVLATIDVELCGVPMSSACAAFADTFINAGSKYMNKSRILVYHCNFPAGTSVKNIIHYVQHLKSQRAQKFDYGPIGNLREYGQEHPPEYKPENVKTDIGVFHSRGDQFVTEPTIDSLIKTMGSRVKLRYYIDDPEYTHMTFPIGINNPKVLHPTLLKFLGNYTYPEQ